MEISEIYTSDLMEGNVFMLKLPGVIFSHPHVRI